MALQGETETRHGWTRLLLNGGHSGEIKRQTAKRPSGQEPRWKFPSDREIKGYTERNVNYNLYTRNLTFVNIDLVRYYILHGKRIVENESESLEKTYATN